MRTLTVFLAAFLMAAPAVAQDAMKTSTDLGAVPGLAKPDTTGISYDNVPDASTLPALRPFRERQAKFYYMGRTAGLDGWFMMLPDNYVQMAYTSLDGNDLIIGFITDSTGKSVSEQQMVNLREREPDVNKLFTDKIEDAKARLSRDRGFQELTANLNMDKPGDKMYAEFSQAPSIEVGDKKAPLLLMAIDPMCAFCKQAYRDLEKPIKKGKVLVHIIPVAILGDDSMRMAAKLLEKPDDNALWLDYAAKDFSKDVLAGEPNASGRTRYSINAGLYNRWKLHSTPFFAYRAKDGTIKVLNELPRDWDSLLGDLAPAPSLKP